MAVESVSFRKLEAWKDAMRLVDIVYEVSSGFPGDEKWALTSQIRRACISVPSAIAEGHGRKTPGDFSYFLRVARGSVSEVETQILIARKLNYATEQDVEAILAKTQSVVRLVNGLIRYLAAKP